MATHLFAPEQSIPMLIARTRRKGKQWEKHAISAPPYPYPILAPGSSGFKPLSIQANKRGRMANVDLLLSVQPGYKRYFT